MNTSSRQYSSHQNFRWREQNPNNGTNEASQRKRNIAKIFLIITAGIMDAYSRLLCALVFWDGQFMEGEWLIKRIWEYEKVEN